MTGKCVAMYNGMFEHDINRHTCYSMTGSANNWAHS